MVKTRRKVFQVFTTFAMLARSNRTEASALSLLSVCHDAQKVAHAHSCSFTLKIRA